VPMRIVWLADDESADGLAGGQVIALGSPSIIRQCLDRRLVDRIRFNLVPLLLGWSATGFISVRCPGRKARTEAASGCGLTECYPGRLRPTCGRRERVARVAGPESWEKRVVRGLRPLTSTLTLRAL
jgi:hypothetical protein